MERAGRAGDPEAAKRFGQSLRRAGELDPQLVEAMRWLDSERADGLLGAWALASGQGRIRLYAGMAAAGVRYPDPAFLSALSGPERELCSVVSWMRGNNVARGDTILVDCLKLAGTHPHTIELVHSDSDDPESSQAAHRGPEGLVRARERAAVVESGWAPLVRTVTPHTRGDGFYEVAVFLTPAGYAVSDRLYSNNDLHRGVVSWHYDVTERHISGPDSLEHGVFGITPCLRTISEIHALETRVQLLLETTGRGFGNHGTRHIPGWLVAQAINGWNETPGSLVLRNAPCMDMGGVGHCLVVIPSTEGTGVTLPFVTIGISRTSSAPRRTRTVTPGHFWNELLQWKAGRALEARLNRWASTEADDRVRVQGDLALMWSRWNHWLHERFVYFRQLAPDEIAIAAATYEVGGDEA